ncbi:MAG: hypothetical protein ABIH00_04005 [Armatimonadota bacterium]
MKKNIIILLLAVFMAVSLTAGFTQDYGKKIWQFQHTGIKENLNAVYALDENTVWAAGDNGRIINSVDGGQTWTVQESTTDEHLADIYFLDNMNGYAAGENSVFLKTTDSGKTWTNYPLHYLINYKVLNLHFMNKNEGCVTGTLFGMMSARPTGFIGRTSNGGENFKITNIFDMNTINALFFLDDKNGWASGTLAKVASIKAGNKMYTTTDGGQNWNGNYFMKGGTFVIPVVYDIFFIDDKNGWAAGSLDGDFGSTYARIHYTKDGGDTWKLQTLDQYNGYLRKIQFFDKQNGVAVGGSPNINNPTDPLIIYTTDGGAIWKKAEFYDGVVPFGACFVNSKCGWLVGEGGAVYKYYNK